MPDPQGDTLLVRCKCGNPMRVSRQFVGREMTCYACGRAFVVGGARPQPQAGGAKRDDGRALVPSPPPAASPPAPAAGPGPQGQPPAIYIVQNPPPAVPPQTIFVTPPHMTATHEVHLGSPVPPPEETIWEGRPALACHLPGMIWSVLWLLGWVALATGAWRIVEWLKASARAAGAESGDAVAALALNPAYVAAFFLLLAAWAGWRLTERILVYLNTYYIFTNQRLRLRQGVLSREMSQMELFRVKDFSLVEPLWGRLMGYAHVRVLSSDRLAGDVLLEGLPGGAKTMDKMRLAAQLARSQTGVATIHE